MLKEKQIMQINKNTEFLEIVKNVVTISGMDTLNIWTNYLLERENTRQMHLKTVPMVKKNI